MRLELHNKIGKNVCNELIELGCYVNKKLFLLGNIFPDLCFSFLWCRHEHQYSRDYTRKKIEMLKRKPKLFSFHLGVLTHYICDYFCYPHSSSYNKGLIHHIIYEIQQKAPKESFKINLNIKAFTIEELDRFIEGYDNIRAFFESREYDSYFAAMVAYNFLKAAY
ncbi:MAG: zinc dependent phospholipase C family protein [Treponema sp.]|nr:zinc dependent phospholipase C family protein [Treponema sp.]